MSTESTFAEEIQAIIDENQSGIIDKIKGSSEPYALHSAWLELNRITGDYMRYYRELIENRSHQECVEELINDRTSVLAAAVIVTVFLSEINHDDIDSPAVEDQDYKKDFEQLPGVFILIECSYLIMTVVHLHFLDRTTHTRIIFYKRILELLALWCEKNSYKSVEPSN